MNSAELDYKMSGTDHVINTGNNVTANSTDICREITRNFCTLGKRCKFRQPKSNKF